MRLILSALLLALSTAALAAEPVPFFNGKDFTGWDGDTEKTWKIENGRIVLCSLEQLVPHNEFLWTENDKNS